MLVEGDRGKWRDGEQGRSGEEESKQQRGREQPDDRAKLRCTVWKFAIVDRVGRAHLESRGCVVAYAVWCASYGSIEVEAIVDGMRRVCS